jgi:hypothetical protein
MKKFLKVQQKIERSWYSQISNFRKGRLLFFASSLLFFGLFSSFRFQTNADFRQNESHLPVAAEFFDRPSYPKNLHYVKSSLEGVSIHSGTKNYEKNHKILLGLGSAFHLQDSWSLVKSSTNVTEISVNQEKTFSDCKGDLENLILELKALPADSQCEEKITLFYQRAGSFFLDYLLQSNLEAMKKFHVKEVSFTDFSTGLRERELFSGITLNVSNEQTGSLKTIDVQKKNIHKILPNLSDRLDKIQQLIYSFQENRPLLTQQIQNNTALSSLKNKFATVLTDLNSLQLRTSSTGELKPRLDREYLPLNFQMYVTPFPKLGLSGSCSANLRRRDISFGLGKAGWKPLSSKSSRFGLLYGGSCDMKFQPLNGSSFKYSYRGLCVKTFVGLGLKF